MREFYDKVIDYFGESWFEENWNQFCKVREEYLQGSFAQEILKIELNLHPLLKEVFKWQSSRKEKLDFTKIPKGHASDFILSHLGRDLELLKEEIKARGNSIKRDLLDPKRYESARFVILIAAGYKLLGYKVEFLPLKSGKMTPDLLVKKDRLMFLIECKQRNQDEADEREYLFFGELAEKYIPILKSKSKNTILNIQIFKKLTNELMKDLNEAISKLIWRNQKIKDNRFQVSLTRNNTDPELITLLKSGGHFGNAPVFTRFEDMFIASEPVNKNLIGMTKSAKEEKIPPNVYEELKSANKHIKEDKKLIVYYDFGRGFSSWTDNIGKQTFEQFGEIKDNKEFNNIDLFVFCQTLIKYKGSVTQIQPSFNFIGDKTRIGGTPIELNLFGIQGHTGIDSYIIPHFVVPQIIKLNQT